jgi:hypothetical protein
MVSSGQAASISSSVISPVGVFNRCLEVSLDGRVGHSHLGQQFQGSGHHAHGPGLLRGVRRAIDRETADAPSQEFVRQSQTNQSRSDHEHIEDRSLRHHNCSPLR